MVDWTKARIDMDPRKIGRIEYVEPPKMGRPRGRPRHHIPPGTGEKVRRLIQERYGTQGKAAQAWGCSRQYVSMVCLEQSPPSKIIRQDLGL